MYVCVCVCVYVCVCVLSLFYIQVKRTHSCSFFESLTTFEIRDPKLENWKTGKPERQLPGNRSTEQPRSI